MKLRLRTSMSLDGFTAGPDQSVDNPLGIGGMRLHEWVFPLSVWREMHGLPGGVSNENDQVVKDSIANIGAGVMGRNMFGGHPGSWDANNPWNGWWGTNPPYHHPVFVLTHHPHAPIPMEGGTTFHFVTDGIESALEQAFVAANGKDVRLGGGAATIQEYLRAGRIDEMHVAIVPILLGRGERLFDNLDDGAVGYECVEFVASPAVAHARFVRSAPKTAENH